jgi:hypothetical protein
MMRRMSVKHFVICAVLFACGGSKPEPAAPSSAGSGAGAGGSTPAGVGQVCGTRGATPCSADLFCNYQPGAECGATDKPGQCAAKPAACPRIAAPVCGCHGTTSGNSCEASAAGVGVKQTGACG